MRLRNIPGADEAVAASPFVIHDPLIYRGQWHSLFPSNGPIHIEIGMGKGQFLMQLASLHPENCYIGIERYTSVLLRAIQKMQENPLPNLYFLCVDASNLTEYFSKEEVDLIYLNFSDPWPKDRHARRRLTSPDFLDRYDQILNKKGRLEFKTDNTDLFDYSLTVVRESKWNLDAFTYDLHHDEALNQNNIMTEYEQKFAAKGNPIHKMIISRY